jgi:hypothetical protein
LGSVFVTAQITAVVHRRLPEHHAALPYTGRLLLPSGDIIFILYDMTVEVGQGSGSSERMGGYDRFISLLFYTF